MYREYTFLVRAVRYGLKLYGVMRVTGDIVPGATVQVQARALKSSITPAKWATLSSPKPVVVGPNLTVSYSLDSGGWKVSGEIQASSDLGKLIGVGKASWTVLSSDLELSGLKTAEDMSPDTPIVAPVAGKWSAKEIASYSKDYKIKAIVSVPRGFLVTTYNRYTRQHSFIDEYVNDKRTMIWEASKAKGQSAETIGGGIRVGDLVYFIPEVGKNVLKYNTSVGKVSKGTALGSDQEFAIEMCLYDGRAVFGGSNEGGSRTAIYDAETGQRLFDSPRKGLISALASAGDTLWWVVAGSGICNSNGGNWPLEAASIAIWNGVPVVGSQVDGTLYKFTGSEWKPMHKVESSKINRLVVDTRDNCLLLAASNPDTFLRFLPSGAVEVLGRWADQGVSVSGEQFDAFINEGPSGTILGSRALANGCKGYRFSMIGSTPVPDPVLPDEPEVPDAPGAPANKGGDGLYKPESNLWLLPSGIKAEHVKWAGEVDPSTQAILRYFKWPAGGFSLDSKAIDGNNVAWAGAPPFYYHNNRLKMRNAKASASGVIFRCGGLNNKVLAEMTIKDRNVRQEGK